MGDPPSRASLLCLVLLDMALCVPVLHRTRRYIPLDVEEPLELPVEHFGLVDDYGVEPKLLAVKQRVTRPQPAGLVQAGKSKRDEPDLDEFYYDDVVM
ncbi:hypothetical protein FKM82_021592 [Ascaphus truei]